MRLNNKLKIFFSAIILLSLIGCNGKDGKTPTTNTIKVGTITGPETQLMEKAKEVAQKTQGLVVNIIEFNDYTMPNTALSDGSIDANMFQHQPYLDATVKAKNYPIVAIGKTFLYPMGIYSQKLKNIANVPKGATVAIPNDPSNEARALILLQRAQLITLKPNTGVLATVSDIATNPKKLKIKELDAAQLPRVLQDVSLAVINSNYAVAAGMLPTRDAIYMEKTDSPYANIVVVRTSDKDNPKFKQLLDALHSQDVKNEAKKLFDGAAIPAWSNTK